MFTVKHIGMLGDEAIYPADKVTFLPVKAQEMTQAGESLPKPVPKIVLDGITELCGGTVFVMNDKGRTVSRYDLGASPVPIMPGVDGLTATRVVAAEAGAWMR